jgi:hypothetical protein
LAKKVRAKGRNPLGFQILLIALWLGGGIGGFAGGLSFGLIVVQHAGVASFLAIGGLLLGPACATGLVNLLVYLMPAAEGANSGIWQEAPGEGLGHADGEGLRRRAEDSTRHAHGDAIADRPKDLPRGQFDDRIQD